MSIINPNNEIIEGVIRNGGKVKSITTPPDHTEMTYHSNGVTKSIETSKIKKEGYLISGEPYYKKLPATIGIRKFSTGGSPTFIKDKPTNPTEYWVASYDINENQTMYENHLTGEHWEAEYNKNSKILKYVEYLEDGVVKTKIWKYDTEDRMTYFEDEDGNIVTYEYDDRGNMIRSTNNSNPDHLIEEVRGYDEFNREIYCKNSEGLEYWTIYDKLGRPIVSTSDPTSTESKIIGAEQIECVDIC